MRDDLNILLSCLLEFAQLMLRDHGEFLPFGAGLSRERNVTSLGAEMGEDHPRSRDVVEVLFSALAKQAANGEIIAAGICTDVLVVPPGQEGKSDAICLELEHQDGETVDVFLPYARNDSGEVTYGELLRHAR